MRKNGGNYSGKPFSDRSWILPFLASLMVSLTLFLATSFGLFSSRFNGESLSIDILSFTSLDEYSLYTNVSKLENNLELEPPRLAYLITGTKGDSLRMRRVLQAIYHPRNQYILHLDLEAPPRERIDLAMYVKTDALFSEMENVRVIAKANLVTYKGPTMVACTLHAIAILLKESAKWDWFINLSASDYPLMTQDEMLHVFSSLPREINFIEHTQSIGWKVNQRAKPIIIDPGLYLSKKYDLLSTGERRDLPTSFKLFTGSAWVMLTREFLEYIILGYENLPRTVLMYYTNFISSPEGYFHTVICNSRTFSKSAISHDLHYIAWDTPPKQHPRTLSMKDFDRMVKSGAPFARKFPKNDPVLDKIDRELLNRTETGFAPGMWSLTGDDSAFVVGKGVDRFRELMKKLMGEEFRNGSCSNLRFDQSKREWVS